MPVVDPNDLLWMSCPNGERIRPVSVLRVGSYLDDGWELMPEGWEPDDAGGETARG